MYLLLVENTYLIKQHGIVAWGRILYGEMPDSLKGKECTIIKREYPLVKAVHKSFERYMIGSQDQVGDNIGCLFEHGTNVEKGDVICALL